MSYFQSLQVERAVHLLKTRQRKCRRGCRESRIQGWWNVATPSTTATQCWSQGDQTSDPLHCLIESKRLTTSIRTLSPRGEVLLEASRVAVRPAAPPETFITSSSMSRLSGLVLLSEDGTLTCSGAGRSISSSSLVGADCWKAATWVCRFQEQLLRIAMTVADFSGAEADELRRAVGMRRSWERMKSLESKLRAGMTTRISAGHHGAISAVALYGFPQAMRLTLSIAMQKQIPVSCGAYVKAKEVSVIRRWNAALKLLLLAFR